MDEPAAKSKMPIDRFDVRAYSQLRQPGLLGDFTQCRRIRLFAILEMTFRKSPVLIAVANEQINRLGTIIAKNDTARRRLITRLAISSCCRPFLAFRHTPAVACVSVCPVCNVARPSMNWRTTGSLVFRISSTLPTWRTLPSNSIAMRVPTK